MYPGKPCFFVTIGKGCNDYENRPDFPCKDFKCEWIVNDSMPEHLGPKDTNILIVKDVVNDIKYSRAVVAGDKVDNQAIHWYIDYYRNNLENFWFELNRKNYVIGSEDFINETQRMRYGTVRYQGI
jgi:hypothetical protein